LKHFLKHIILLAATVVFFANAIAQPFSYIYIQGDKEMPFYVKLEGKMMPRYGKNYCILSELSPGPIHIEILFQQHADSPQKFTINVPENGYRGFLLNKQNNKYLLYDLQTKKCLALNGDQ
jgi:hypothetical protein